jgi:protein-L-isoaspartate(D-aspartate) O-methyltransferase
VLQSSDMVTDTDETRALRDNLLRRLADEGELRTQRVVAAMREVPRHLFCPDGDLDLAYANHPLEIGHGQTISQPTIVAMMTEALDLRGDERVLEIGTGSGYQAAVLSRLCGRVYSIERIAALANEARRRLLMLGYDNVEVRVGDGYEGWPEEAPFDRVVVTAAPPAIPLALVEQLAEGGILVAPVGGDADTDRQSLLRATKRRRGDGDGGLVLEDLGGVRFVTMLRGTTQA